MERLFLMFLDHTHNDAAQSVGLLWTSGYLSVVSVVCCQVEVSATS